MKNISKILLMSVLTGMAYIPLYGQSASSVNDAIARGDIKSLVSYSLNPELEPQIMDALLTNCSFDNMVYEELEDLRKSAKSGSQTEKLITDAVERSKDQIRNQISELSIENIMKYEEQFPQRKKLIEAYFQEVVSPRLDSLSYLELNYLNTVMPQFEKKRIGSLVFQRVDEKKKLMSSNVHAYTNSETETLPELKYTLEKISWAYFIEAYEQVAQLYSQIPMVPDDPNVAINQYRSLVNSCFSPSLLQKMLQKEVNEYCAQINKARRDYALIAGMKDYVKFSYTVPNITLHTSTNINNFYNIPSARNQFVQSRQNVSEGSGFVGWLTGGVAGLFVKGLGDWLVISDLVNEEYKIRNGHMKLIHDALFDDFQEYTRNLVNKLEITQSQNQKNYEKTIRQ